MKFKHNQSVTFKINNIAEILDAKICLDDIGGYPKLCHNYNDIRYRSPACYPQLGYEYYLVLNKDFTHDMISDLKPLESIDQL